LPSASLPLPTNALKLDLEAKNIKRDLSTIDKKVAVKQGREFANDVLSVVDFENEDELRNKILEEEKMKVEAEKKNNQFGRWGDDNLFK